MPIDYARRLTSSKRSRQANLHLGFTLAFVAGATNAGGYLAVQQYTSHMTGIVSSMADYLVLGMYEVVLDGAGALLSFMAGAATTAVMINHARRHHMHSLFALPLLLEACLLLVFGALGSQLAAVHGLFVPLTVMLLCFVMGLQNAVITKISNAEVRTTHITGIVTDIGIELGKLLYWNRDHGLTHLPVRANRERLRMLATLAVSFFVGGMVGALGFQHAGYLATLPLALMLLSLAVIPAVDDVMRWLRRP